MLYLHCCKKCPQILQVKTLLQMYAAFLPVEFMTSEIENLLLRIQISGLLQDYFL